MNMRTPLGVAAAVACAALLLACAAAAAAPHKFHTSLAQAEYNAESKRLEVSLRVFAGDLEEELSRRSKKPVRLDSTKDADALAFAYLRETFQVRAGGGRLAELVWVGKEARGDVAWLYFEVALPDGLAGAELRDAVFFTLVDDQVNTVNLKHAGRRRSLVFKRGDDGFKPLG